MKIFKPTQIRTKLLVAFLILAIIPFAAIGIISLKNSEQALSSLAFGQLISLREVKKAQIESFFAGQKKDVKFLLQTVDSLKQAAFAKLDTVQENKKAQLEAYFQKCLNDISVISNSSTVLRAMADFSSVMDEQGHFDAQLYNFFETVKYDNSLKQYQEVYGYDDFLLIKKTGEIVFTLNRQSDLGKNAVAATSKQNNFSRCFKKAISKINIQDFEPYEPAGGQYRAFIGAPITEKSGEIAGVVMLRINSNAVNTIVQRREGMGETGETFTAGVMDDEARYRSSRELASGDIGEPCSDGYIRYALWGSIGPVIKLNNAGVMEIAKYDPLQIEGLDWVIATSMSLEEAIAPELNPYDDYFSQYTGVFGYSDLLLIAPNGNVFYSVKHNADYGTNLRDGPYGDSGLSNLFKKILDSRSFAFADFEAYPPRGGEQSAFIGAPMIHREKVELLVVLQMPLEMINTVMASHKGVGTTGEAYLVGPDKRLRSNSYQESENKVLLSRSSHHIDTIASQAALSGKSGKNIITDHRGIRVLSAYTPVHVWDTTWGLIAEIDETEALASLAVLKFWGILVAAISIGSIIIISFITARHFARPITRLTAAAKQVKSRNFDIAVNVKSSDELELLADAFNAMVAEIRSYANELELKVALLEQAEADLRKSSTLLKAVMEGTTDAIFVKDLEGRYLMANAATCKAMGKQCRQVIGKDDRELFEGESARVIDENDSRVLDNAQAIRAEERLKTAYGDTYWQTNKSPYLDKDGNIIGIIGISRNVTEYKIAEKEKKKLEAQLRQSHKMEAIGTLAGGIAHDFNNILAAILGYSEMVYGDLPPGTIEKEYIAEVLHACHRAKDLVKQILAFSRKSEQVRTPLQIHLIIKEALLLLRASIPATIEIRQGIDPQCGYVLADPTQIHQVLMNICTNAAQSMEENGGVLTITLERVEWTEKDFSHDFDLPSGLYVRLIIQDTGSGIDPGIRDRIFDPYFTTKEVGKGSGMGLAVVIGIVKSHDGGIRVTSKPGKGTKVSVYFPLVMNRSNSTAKAAEEVLPAGSESILVIDDEPAVVEITKKRLEKAGYRVTGMTSSTKALAFFRSQPAGFDLILTDQTMPELTGIKLAEAALAVRPDIPIILCTGHSSIANVETAENMGIQQVLIKPVENKELLITIKNTLNGRGVKQ